MPGLRQFPVRKTYVVFYRVNFANVENVEIVRIVHGRRDFRKLFEA